VCAYIIYIYCCVFKGYAIRYWPRHKLSGNFARVRFWGEKGTRVMRIFTRVVVFFFLIYHVSRSVNVFRFAIAVVDKFNFWLAFRVKSACIMYPSKTPNRNCSFVRGFTLTSEEVKIWVVSSVNFNFLTSRTTSRFKLTYLDYLFTF